MRGLKSTLALIVVLIGLGAYIYFVTWQQSDEDAASTLEKVFVGTDAQNIQELKIKAEAGDVTTVRKTAEKWEVVEPVQAEAGVGEVEAITSALSALEI